MLKASNHAGVESYIVKNIKNQVELSMEVSLQMPHVVMLHKDFLDIFFVFKLSIFPRSMYWILYEDV